MSEIDWQEPPPPNDIRDVLLGVLDCADDLPPSGGRKGSAEWRSVADALRANPNRWALVKKDAAHTIAWQIQHGRIAAFRQGVFEAVVRKQPSGKYNVFARCVDAEATR